MQPDKKHSTLSSFSSVQTEALHQLMVNNVDLCECEWSTVLLGNLQQAAERQENMSQNLRQYRRGVQVEFGKSSAAQSGERREITTRR